MKTGVGMPSRIIVCTGDIRLLNWLNRFCVHNRDLLLEMSVLLVAKSNESAQIACAADADSALELDPPAYVRLLRSWAGTDAAPAWILPLPQSWLAPQRFMKTLALCRFCSRQAKITWVHGVTPAVPSFRMFDTWMCFTDPIHPVPDWLDRLLRFTVPFSLPRAISSSGKPELDAIFMPFDNDEYSTVSQMLGAIGVDMDAESERRLLAVSPVLCAPLARDTRAYILALKNLFLRFGRPVSTWSDEGDIFRAGEDFSCVFSPEECARITQSTKQDCEIIAKHNNVPVLPDYVPDPDWRPFTGLRREQVSHLMERHSPDFGAKIRDFLAGLEPRLLTAHEQEIFADFLPRQSISVPASMLEEGEPPRPKVSVLTPAYNHAAFIKDCIEGVLAQKTSFPIEHIIADDGSSDGTQDIILEYASRYPHIVPVMHPNNSGGYVNHRDLYQMARAPYVALCDGDDYFTDPLKLQTQADLLDAKPSLGLCFHLTTVHYQNALRTDWVYPPPEQLPGGVRPRYLLEDLLRANLMQTSSVMYRWRFGPVLPEGLVLGTVPSDWYLHLVHAEHGAIGFINKIMSVYRRHENALYSTAETSHVKHRRKYGMEELYSYYVINKHFKGKYMAIMQDLASGVITDLILDAANTDDGSILTDVTQYYPEFAQYTLKRLGIV